MGRDGGKTKKEKITNAAGKDLVPQLRLFGCHEVFTCGSDCDCDENDDTSDGSRDDDEDEDGHVEGDQEYGHVDAGANAHESQSET